MRALLRRSWTGGYAIGFAVGVLALISVPLEPLYKGAGVLIAIVLGSIAIVIDLVRHPPIPTIDESVRGSIQFEEFSGLAFPCIGVVQSGPSGPQHFTATAANGQAECMLLEARAMDARVDGSLNEVEAQLRQWRAVVITAPEKRVRALRAFRISVPRV